MHYCWSFISINMYQIIPTIVILFILWVYKRTQKPKDFPPGPPRVPVLGSVPFLKGNNFLQNIIDLKSRFGDFYGLYLGNQPTIVISDLAIAKEVFSKEETAARGPVVPYQESFPGWEKLWEQYPDQVSNGNCQLATMTFSAWFHYIFKFK